MWNTYRCADLDEVLANGLAVVHGVEGSDFVDAHWGYFEHARDLVHDTDASPAMLALAEVQQGHDGSLLILRGVAFEDLVDELEVLLRELEGDVGVVVRVVAVLSRQHCLSSRAGAVAYHGEGLAAALGPGGEEAELGLGLGQGIDELAATRPR